MATPAIRAITAGARTNVPTCQITIFFRLQTCFPQKVPKSRFLKILQKSGDKLTSRGAQKVQVRDFFQTEPTELGPASTGHMITATVIHFYD